MVDSLFGVVEESIEYSDLENIGFFDGSMVVG